MSRGTALESGTVCGVNSSTSHPGGSSFRTTHWSIVLAAGGSRPDSRTALEELCGTYWRPIHGFIRRRGYDPSDARDLTQGFFARFLERDDVEGLDPARGRFRSYLLAAVKNFLVNEQERERALKRGGGTHTGPLILDDEADLALEPADTHTPESAFERQWALALLRCALERVRVEQVSAGRGELFEHLKPTLAGESLSGGHAAVAKDLGLTTVAVKVAAHRLKKRYRELLLEELARTVDLPQDIEDELHHLFRALER